MFNQLSGYDVCNIYVSSYTNVDMSAMLIRMLCLLDLLVTSACDRKVPIHGSCVCVLRCYIKCFKGMNIMVISESEYSSDSEMNA
jgi:hypothetical protein